MNSAIGSRLDIDATKKLPGDGFKRDWRSLIKMDEAVRKKMDQVLKASDNSLATKRQHDVNYER